MTQSERRLYLIRELLKERKQSDGLEIPSEEGAQQKLLRALLNVRPPCPAARKLLEIQDAYLQEEIRSAGITDLAELKPVRDGIYLWRGDITALRCDAVVNAANSQLLGCFLPCHGCVDNAIHTKSGIQLRLYCDALMKQQGHEEPTGKAKITPAYNLPCKYILHTVGPIVSGTVTQRDCELLASCYRSCLQLAAENGCKSIAFCCISTGEFRFPNERAAEIAVETVNSFLNTDASGICVIFNVYKQIDMEIYQKILGVNRE